MGARDEICLVILPRSPYASAGVGPLGAIFVGMSAVAHAREGVACVLGVGCAPALLSAASSSELSRLRKSMEYNSDARSDALTTGPLTRLAAPPRPFEPILVRHLVPEARRAAYDAAVRDAHYAVYAEAAAEGIWTAPPPGEANQPPELPTWFNPANKPRGDDCQQM